MLFYGGDIMLINEVSKLLNISKDTIRYYEKLGLLETEKIDNKRDFKEKDIDRLKQIMLLKNAKFKLTEILTLIELDNKFQNLDSILNMDNDDLTLLKNLVENKLNEIEILKKDILTAQMILIKMKNKLKEINHDIY